MTRVLCVCLGNICRSPMAEAMLRHKVAESGLADRILVDSAGTGDWHVGKPPHSGTRAVLDARGIDHASIRARLIERADLDRFDWILTMDEANRRAVSGLGGGRAKVVPVLDFHPDPAATEVPDPYFDGRFEEVHALLDRALEGFLDALRRENGW
ncbi:MAG: low molecular weight protein-tyrosine-phosphatase [Armatimonadota bacterium]